MQQPEYNTVMPKCQLVSLDLGVVVFQGQTAQLTGKFIQPCPVTKFPKIEQLSDAYLRWMVENGLIEKEDIAKYETLKFSTLFTSAVSDLPIHFAKYMPICSHLMWIIDNPIETACKKTEDIEALKYMGDLIVKCLEGKHAQFRDEASHSAYKYKEVCFQDNLHILCSALDRFQQEIRDYATRNHYAFFNENWQRFCDEFRCYLNGLVWAGAEKVKKHHLPKDLYLKLREATSGVTIIFMLGATLLDFNLSKIIEENNVIFRTMSTLGNLILSIMNDIASLGGEIKQAANEETFNENFIINMFHQHKKKTPRKANSFQSGIARAIKVHNKMMFNFLSLLSSAKNIYKTPEANRYFEIILHVLRDYFDWNFITSRYGLEKLFVIRDERIVSLNQVEDEYLKDPCQPCFNIQAQSAENSYGANPNILFGPKGQVFTEEKQITTDKLPWNFTIGRSKL